MKRYSLTLDPEEPEAIYEDTRGDFVRYKDAKAYKDLAEGLDKLLAAYRTGTTRTPEAALDKIQKAREKIRLMDAG